MGKNRRKCKRKSSKKAAGDSRRRLPLLSSSSGSSRDDNKPRVLAAAAAQPHSNAAGTGSPPLWKSVFGNAWFWDAGRTMMNLQERLTRERFGLTAIIRAGSKIIEVARQSFTGLPPLNEGPPASLQDAIINKLHRAIRDETTEKLHQVKVATGQDDSYSSHQVFYIGNPKFRHQAQLGKSPPQLYMEKADGDLVLLYCSASGSGKTAELAASAFSRDAAFSIHLDVEKDISTAKRGDGQQREARISLKTTIDEVVGRDKGTRALFLEIAQMIKHRNTKDDKVRIVVAIDEAGSQPNLVNDIIRNYEDLGQDLAAFIMMGCNNPDESGNRLNEKEWKKTQKESLQVVFSIAGTGLHGDMEGTVHENFEQLQPIAKRKVEDVYKVLCEEYPGKSHKFPPFQQLPEYPLLNDIVHHNSRMTSALVFQLATTNFSYGDPRHQAKIITTVFVNFCATNGMSSVRRKPHFRLQVVASAYAALLFQKKITVYPGDAPHVIREKALKDAIRFQHFDEHYVAKRNLLGRFGLLTIQSFADLSRRAEQENGEVEMYPFLMDPAMQRLCSWMIAGGKVIAHADEALGTTPFAYEALAVQFLSSVIAAATTVEPEDRKDLKSMLEDGAAMYASEVRDGGTLTPLFVDKDIEDSWEGLDGWYPVAFPSEFAMEGMYLQKSPMRLSLGQTQPQRSPEQEEENQTYWRDLQGWEVEHNNRTPFVDTNQLTQYTPLQYSSEDTLTIDKDYLHGLWVLRYAIMNKPTLEEGTQAFHPPIASVAEGSSNLADGYVSVVVAQKKEEDDYDDDYDNNYDNDKTVWKDFKLVTICIQAKDKAANQKISKKTIRNTKNNVLHELLHIPFGEDRVYCVASRPESLVNQTMTQADVAEAKRERDEDVGKCAVADALGREPDAVTKAAVMEEMKEVIYSWVRTFDPTRLIRQFKNEVNAKIKSELGVTKEKARNAATTKAEADETHLAPHIATPIGEPPASKALEDTGIHRGEHGKTESFGVQLKYSSA